MISPAEGLVNVWMSEGLDMLTAFLAQGSQKNEEKSRQRHKDHGRLSGNEPAGGRRLPYFAILPSWVLKAGALYCANVLPVADLSLATPTSRSPGVSSRPRLLRHAAQMRMSEQSRHQYNKNIRTGSLSGRQPSWVAFSHGAAVHAAARQAAGCREVLRCRHGAGSQSAQPGWLGLCHFLILFRGCGSDAENLCVQGVCERWQCDNKQEVSRAP